MKNELKMIVQHFQYQRHLNYESAHYNWTSFFWRKLSSGRPVSHFVAKLLHHCPIMKNVLQIIFFHIPTRNRRSIALRTFVTKQLITCFFSIIIIFWSGNLHMSKSRNVRQWPQTKKVRERENFQTNIRWTGPVAVVIL